MSAARRPQSVTVRRWPPIVGGVPALALERAAAAALGRHLFECGWCSKTTNYRCPKGLTLREQAIRLADEGRKGIR